jgi:DNA-binding protein
MIKRIESILFPIYKRPGKSKLPLAALEKAFENNTHIIPNNLDAVEPQRYVTVHGLGAAINDAVMIVTELKDKYKNRIEIRDIQTTSEELVDFIEDAETGEESRQVRLNSAIHIRIALCE